jgi:isoleucyl-tRNA synthetase
MDSVHLEEWPAGGEIDEKLMVDMKLARQVVEQALSLRAGAGIKVRQPLAQLVVTTALRPDLDYVVRSELNVKELHTAEKLPTGQEWVIGENIALDISISDELREEGWCRDLVREFNALRKNAGLQPTDTIIVHCEAGTTAAKIIERFGETFLKDVRAKAATPSMDGATTMGDIKLDQTTEVGISLVTK